VTENIPDTTKRASWAASYAVPAFINTVASSISIGSGSVTIGAQQINFPGAILGQNPGYFIYPGNDQGAPGYNLISIDSSFGHLQVDSVPSLSSSFQAGVLPLCILVTDFCGRIQQVIDQRPSAGGSPTFEVIANPALRASVNANYLVDTTATVSPLLKIGPGAVNVGGNQVNWGGGYVGYRQNMNLLGQAKPELFATPFTAGTQGGLQINQVFISNTTGLPAIHPVSSASAGFPAGSLPLALAYVDASLRIQNVVDVRPMPPL